MALRCARDEAGSTLVELLVTLVILGIAFVTLLGGMFTAVTTSHRHRQQTVADSALRSFAEAVKVAGYRADCAGYEDSYTPASGFTRRVVRCCALESTTTTTTTTIPLPSIPLPAPSCPPPSAGDPQVLTLEVASTDGRATETIEVVKRDERPSSTTSSIPVP